MWRSRFGSEAPLIAGALSSNLVAVHHLGSTAIPDIYAKPIVDFLVEVKDITAVDASPMSDLGYEAMGEFGSPSLENDLIEHRAIWTNRVLQNCTCK